MEYDLPAGPLGRNAARAAAQAGISLSFDPALTDGLSSPAVSGRYTPKQVMRLLLAGSGLELAEKSDGTFTLRTQPAPSRGASELRKVRVVADEETSITESTGAYTASTVSIGKAPASLRQTPQSVSVLTRQRLDDQNFVELTEAMKYVPGVAVRRQSATGNRSDIYSRGYQASTYQLDGLNIHNNPATIESFDLALYDRVEALRGPAGLYSGAGEPGVTINLARKRARAPFAVQAALGAGSWDRYRVEADVTGALIDSGGVRARLVAVAQDDGSYLKGVEFDKQVAYGTLEFDVSETSTLSVGGTWQRSSGYYDTGLPAYADGRLPNVPRSTAVVADWTTAKPQAVDGFLEWESMLADGGLFKVALRRQSREQRDLYVNAYSAISPSGTSQFTQAQWVARDYDDTTADIFLSLPFEWLGETHNVLAGADYRSSDQLTVLERGTMNTAADLFDYRPDAIPRPMLAPYWNNLGEVESYGVYGQLRFRPFSALTLLAGGRVSWWDSKSFDRGADARSSYDADGEFTPYAAVVFDISGALSLYASYAEIFQPQSNLTAAREQLEPRTGGQYEAGIKGEFAEGRLNASLAAFRLHDEHRALADPVNTGFFLPSGKVRSEGVELEVTGEIVPRVQLTAGYAYTKTEYLKATPALNGQSFSTFTPEHAFNAWVHWAVPAQLVDGLELGAGVRAVSDFYAQSGAIRWVGDSYAVAALQVGYEIDARHKVSLNVENLFDRKYWERVENALRSNYYGAPRNFMVNWRGRF
ncbi:MAG TPA: TonB-dependent siderophore receptor [Steroidobacter sp.]|nr:TonB-dependent siderophore receptor [Steroidobacter sp.]